MMRIWISRVVRAYPDTIFIAHHFIGLAIQGEGTSIVRLAFDVPITLCIGVTVGFVSSVILSFNTIWDRRWKRSTALILLGFISMFGTKYCGYPGSGALGALLTAVLSSRWWSGEESLRLCNRNASKKNQSINKAAVIVQQHFWMDRDQLSL